MPSKFARGFRKTSGIGSAIGSAAAGVGKALAWAGGGALNSTLTAVQAVGDGKRDYKKMVNAGTR